MKRTTRHGIICLTCALTLGCGGGNDKLEQALRLAGDNRAELERVMEHYARTPEDSLKLRAARFLIENMPGHYTLESETYKEMREDIQTDPTLSYFDKKTLDIALSFFPDLRAEATRREDVETLTADYLIRHIDRSFEKYERLPWLREVPFETFAEHILPYRFANEAPDQWIDSIDIDPEALEKMTEADNLKHTAWRFTSNVELTGMEGSKPSDSFLASLMQSLYKDCVFIEWRNNFQNRVAGLPTAVHFMPYFANRNGYHYWNANRVPDDKNTDVKGSSERKAAKIYENTYSRQAHATAEEGEFMPELFTNPFLRDVTEEYAYTADAAVEAIPGTEAKPRHAYLCVFSNLDWQPVAIAEAEGGRFTFRGMGKNVVYLPTYYEGETAVPLNYPFVLNLKGEAKWLVPDTTHTRTLRLTRKYPQTNILLHYVRQLGDIRVTASNKPDFSTPTVMAERLETQETYAECEPAPEAAYRYWQVEVPQNTTCGEILFFDREGDLVRGECPPLFNTAFDGNPLTNLSTHRRTAPVMDFGEPTRIARIVVLPRSDGNGIYPGQTYELLYHDGKGWKSAGRQVARGFSVGYERVPGNALYWLRNLTQGVEERIFTLDEDGEVRFW